MKEYEHRQLMAAGIQIFLRQYRYRLDNINFMDLRYRTKLLNIQTDFYENYIDSIVEDISSGKIDLQNLPCDELFRLFSLCAEIARTYGDGNPIYEYHASIWKGNGEIWECMDPKGVRHREYNPYYKYMNTNNKTIHVVKYFRYKGEQNAKM